MPTIRIDDEVFSWLQGKARPFEDTPNSVLRREARLDPIPRENKQDVERHNGMRRTSKARTRQSEFRAPILQFLRTHSGRADRVAVLKGLESAISLTPFDKLPIKSGAVRWQKAAEWEVSVMRQEGLLLRQADSPRGVWCLSPAGERAAKALPPEPDNRG